MMLVYIIDVITAMFSINWNDMTAVIISIILLSLVFTGCVLFDMIVEHVVSFREEKELNAPSLFFSNYLPSI